MSKIVTGKASLYIVLLKPLFDMVVATALVVLFLPVMLLLALILCFANKGQVFFLQKRIGYREKTFYLLKFKSLKDIRDADGNLLPDEDRQYAFGNFMRMYHLDELPQLLNVLTGRLSLIGPRPLLPEYLEHYSSLQRARHTCKPGIIGLSQVMGGNLLPWNQRLRYDVFYTSHRGAVLDALVILRTLRYFFRTERSAKALFSESFIEYRLRHKAA